MNCPACSKPLTPERLDRGRKTCSRACSRVVCKRGMTRFLRAKHGSYVPGASVAQKVKGKL